MPSQSFTQIGRWTAALSSLGVARAALRALASDVPIDAQIRTLECWAVAHPRRPMPAARAAQSAVDAMRLLGRRDRACLPVSFTLFAVLRAMGERPAIVTGIRRQHGSLSGHAWVEIDGVPVSCPGAQQNDTAFERLYCYPS